MSIRGLCLGLAAMLALSSAADGLERYVSAEGDDGADGRTPETAWRTIARLNEGLPAGGRALLRCGDAFRGTIRVKGGPDAAHPTVVTSYGGGAKPVITSAVRLPEGTNAWTALSEGHCIWRTPLGNPAPGVLVVDGALQPVLRYDYNDVNRMWDFACADGWLYVHATNNPALLAREIRVTVNAHGAWLGSNTELRGLRFSEIGAHGVVAGWTGRDPRQFVSHLLVKDCDFDTIGGSELLGFSRQAHIRTPIRVRYGNGVEFGSNVSDALVEGCTFRGVYDTAYTMQGMPSCSWKNVHVRKCRFEECTQAFEIWCKDPAPGCGFENCSFTDNVCVRVGCGWGAEVRPNRQSAAPLLVYWLETDVVDILVARNKFLGFPSELIHCGKGTESLPAGYRLVDNERTPHLGGMR